MTRVNAGIPVCNLTDQHLLAEHMEITRIATLYRNSVKKKGYLSYGKIPKDFTLGKGHVLFFLNKLPYVRSRYNELFFECRKRGFDNEDKREYFDFIDQDIFVSRIHYKTGELEIKLLIDRISTRISESKQTPRYYRENITKEEAIKILKR